jgi:hypothetical protein
VEGALPLYNNDSVRVQEGGEGILDFRHGMKLRVFNNAELEGVDVSYAEETSLEARILLGEGVVTGHIDPGNLLVIKTRTGSEVTITGTDFFAAYDPARSISIAGNFDGHVVISQDKNIQRLPPGNYVKITNGQMSALLLLPGEMNNRDSFENLLRSTDSPLDVVKRLPDLAPALPTDTPLPPATATLEIPTDATPPDLTFVSADPAVVYVADCGGQTQSQVTVKAYDPSGVKIVLATWTIGSELSQIELMPLDGGYFSGWVGPVNTIGELGLHITAQDGYDNIAAVDAAPSTVKVEGCIQ